MAAKPREQQQARLGSAQTRQGRAAPGPVLLKYWIPKASLWRSLRQSLNLASLPHRPDSGSAISSSDLPSASTPIAASTAAAMAISAAATR